MSKTIYSEIVNPNNNFLFTVEQLNQARIIDKCLPVKCLQCGKTFYISRKNYLAFVREHSQHNIQHSFKFCTKECHVKYVHNNNTQVTKPCLFCGKMVTKPLNQAEKYPNFFCCHSHAASYNNIARGPKYPDREKYQQLLKEKSKSSRLAERRCKFCGQTICSRPEICNSNLVQTISSKKDQNNLVKCGFDTSKLGSIQAYDEFDRIHDIVYDLYYNKNFSMHDIKKHFNIKRIQNVWNLLKVLNIPRRPFTEINLAYSKAHPEASLDKKSKHNYRFKTGYHTNFKGEKVFYRSSYELDYMKYLDENKISYKYEPFRIIYFNTLKGKETFCVPDFLLLETNTIVEVKSNYTYIRQDMIDKMNAYKAKGFNFKLILDHVEYDNCPDLKP